MAVKIVVPLCLLAAGAAGAFYLLSTSDPVEPAPHKPPPVIERPADPKPEPEPVVAPPPAPDRTPDRTEVRRDTEADSGKDLAQGVTGRVLTPAGAPLAQAPVFLMKSAASDPLAIFLANKRGEVIPPTAFGKTDQEGRFRLGTSKSDQLYDIRILTDDYPEYQHAKIKIRSEEWYDAGDLELKMGVTVQGRVVQEGSMAAVQGAQVFLNSSNAALSLLATPGREKGTVALTDASGFYRYNNAPRETTISLAVEAPGFARVEKLNLVLQQETANEFNIELAQGLPMAGTVRTTSGAPVANAQVTATAISSKLPQTAQATTDREGRFELQGLREGPFQVAVAAAMYEEKQERPVFAGATDVSIVLEQRGMARVRVLSKNGTPVKDFKLSLKRHFPNNPIGIGNVPEFRDAQIASRDFEGDTAVVKGIPNGEFVFQIAANHHARTLSQPFTIVAGGDIPEVTVQLTLGGVITGRVLDDRGQPVGGATVATDMNGGFAAETEFGQLFKQFMPDRITKTSVRSAADGTFKLPLLAYGEYMVRVSHSDFCEGAAADIKVEADTEVDAGELTLMRGALISGVCTVEGNPAGQVKVQIGPPQNQNAVPEVPANGPPKTMFMATALTENDGTYRFLKRVPPGTYQIHACKQAGDSNPFLLLLQVKQTARELIVLPGQRELVQIFNIPPQ